MVRLSFSTDRVNKPLVMTLLLSFERAAFQGAPIRARSSTDLAPAFRSGVDYCSCGGRSALAAPLLDADCSGSEGGDLEQPTGYHHVLQKVDHLVLVGEIAVERNSGRHTEYRQRKRDRTHAITEAA